MSRILFLSSAATTGDALVCMGRQFNWQAPPMQKLHLGAAVTDLIVRHSQLATDEATGCTTSERLRSATFRRRVNCGSQRN